MSWHQDILNTARTCLAGAADLLMPRLCQACQAHVPSLPQPGEASRPACLCDECSVQMLSLVAQSYCIRCGSAAPPRAGERADGCQLCPAVLPRFERVVRLGPYAGPLRGLVRRLKYQRNQAARDYLCDMLAQAVLAQLGGGPLDLVLPVPAHWRRRMSRAYDHSRAIAGGLAQRLKLPLGSELIRVRHTPPQTHLPRTRRLENIHGAFEVAGPKAIAGASILLVDDVTTTGATANECARTLLRADAARVFLAVAAKSEPPRAYAHVYA